MMEHAFNHATDGFGALSVDGISSCISMKLMMMNVVSVLVACPLDKIRSPVQLPFFLEHT